MDVWEHFATRDREVAEQSATWDEDLYPYGAEAGSSDRRGMIYGRVLLTDHAFVSVHEVVQVNGTGVAREKYAYYVIYDGAELWGEERDPTHTPPMHAHDRNLVRHPCSVAFNDFLTNAWAMVAAEEELPAITEEAPVATSPDTPPARSTRRAR